MQKPNYEDVKNYIEETGYKLLTPEKDYVNSATKIAVQCNCDGCGNTPHEPYMVKFGSFKQGSRCKRALHPRMSYSKVKEHIEASGYNLLSKV